MTDIVDRLRAMQGMGDIQLRALMDGVGPQAADEIERLRSETSRLQKEADKFEDGIDWVQRALQDEAGIDAAVQTEREACATICDIKWMAQFYCAMTARACAEEIRARGDS